MFQRVIQAAINAGARVGADPSDSDDVRLQKSLLVMSTVMFLAAGLVWGLMYFALGETAAGWIPFAYGLVALLSLAGFALTGRYRFFRFSQLVLILLLPFLLMAALGGFINGSVVILWALTAPMGALIFDEPQRAPAWFLGYLGLVVASGLLGPVLRGVNALTVQQVRVFFVLNVGAVSAVVFVLLYTFVRQRNALLALLRLEQAKSENLLLNILPAEVAALLKAGERTIADYFPGASILFADMVGFTPLTAAMAPAELISLLNEVFTHFDDLVDKYGLEKIRTIGDSYMVASGVPRPRADHAQALARLALDMRDYVLTDPRCVERRLSFRLGLNSGPVVAGVIGRKKFIYDLWGDAVNTASRMESHGTPDRIQITRETHGLIQDEFVCEPRGTIMVKGKGEMEAWYLLAERTILQN
ncbi:MAG: adenylate/guanylate cyclase domain-containing protein [Anaerolineales bacterium]|nr:adenylate/guanylate cyclase domain-containing protein [Anaerolineales bacterium]